ncbi:MAG: RNA polymerase factor sigma-54, partial [Aeromonas veronii]
MKPTLQLRLGQSLTMTPQLQQAIRLLQLSTLELQQEIQQALENNPLLEQEESEAQETSPEAPVDASQLDSSDAMAQEQMPDELPVDTTWDEVYSAGTAQSAGPIHDGEDSVYQGETTENLQDYLLWQMRLTPFSDVDAAIALAIIDAIDESGYLTVALEDIQAAVTSDDVEVELDEVEAVLKRVQHFDPVGIAARSVQECLLIQLDQYDPQTPWLNEAKEVILEHMELLGNRDYRTL